MSKNYEKPQYFTHPHDDVRVIGTVSNHQKWSASCTRRFCCNAPRWFFRSARKESLLFLPQHLQTSARVQQQVWVRVQIEGYCPQPCRRARASIPNDLQLLQPSHDDSSQPKSLSLGGGMCSGPDTDLHSPDTFTGHQRPHPSQDFWQYVCTVHSTIKTQIRDDVHYCEPQSWGENNVNSGYFISCLNIVSSHADSCREFMVDLLGRYRWFSVC